MASPMYGVDKDGNPVPFRVDTRAEKWLLAAWRVAVLLALVGITVGIWVRW